MSRLKAILNSLSNRFAIEVLLEFFFIFTYIWVVEIYAPSLFRKIFFWTVVVAFPILCISIEQRQFPEFSLDWKQFLKAFRILLWFTVIGTAFFIFIALYFKTLNYDGQFLKRVTEYTFWGFLQQIGLQTFLTWRVHKVFKKEFTAAFLSSAFFAVLHAPNIALVVFSWVAGFFWALSYIRAPNLFALAVSHGWLAVVALHCVPRDWMHGLRIGPTYWKF